MKSKLRMLTISVYGIFILGLFFSVLAAGIEVTILADNNYPPYSYGINGRAEGIYTEILEQAFSRMSGYQITIRPVMYKSGLALLESGNGFAIYPPYFRPDERPYIHPYSVPILDEEVVVFCRGEILIHGQKANWPDDYMGLTIGLNTGFELGGKAFRQAVEKGNIFLEEASSNQANIMKLAMGRIDCYINDRLSVLWTLKQLKAQGQYIEGQHAGIAECAVISSEKGYLGFTARDNGKYPFKEDFVIRFNGIIEEMQKKGEIQTIVRKYIE